MTVYVVEQGCYSDRQIVGIFSQYEKAALFCAANNRAEDDYYDCEISEYELDGWDIDGNIKPMYVYTASNDGGRWGVGYPRILSLEKVRKLRSYSDSFYIVLKSPDKEKAEKIMYDKLAERKAREAGI